MAVAMTLPIRAHVSAAFRTAAYSSIPLAAQEFVQELLAPPSAMRIDNILRQYGHTERRRTRQYLRKHTVLGAPSPAEQPSRLQTAAEKVLPSTVSVDGEDLQFTQPLHLAMYKPAGVACTRADDEGPTVFDMLPEMFALRDPSLQCVGRLDRATTGLLLFTQSGQLNHRLTAPGRGVPKTYKVRTAAPLCPSGREAAVFASGSLTLEDGSLCRPATLRPHPSDPHWSQVTLTQGMYHQVRRMFAAMGHTVVALHRSGVGPLTVSGLGLQPGDWRPLGEPELTALAVAASKPDAVAVPAPRRMSIAQAAAAVAQGDGRPDLGLERDAAEFRQSASRLFETSAAGQRAAAALGTRGRSRSRRKGATKTD